MGKHFIQRLNKVMKKLDMLSQPFEIKPKSEEKNGTFCGGFISLMFAAFVIVYYIYKVQEQTLKNKTLYLGPTDYNQVRQQLNQDQMKLMIAFSQNINDTIQSLKYSDIHRYVTLNIENNQNYRAAATDQNQLFFQKTTQNIRYQACNMDYIRQFNIPQMNFLQEDDFICLDDAFQIQGKYQDDLFKYLKISIGQCNNSTSDQICMSENKIKDQLARLQVNVIILNAQVDKGTNGHSDSIIYSYQSFHNNLDIGDLHQQYDIYMKSVKIEEIKEAILDMDPQLVLVEQGTLVDRYDQHFSRYGDLASFYLRYEQQSETYFRRTQGNYIKFLVALTTIGGLIAAFTTTFAAMYRVYHKHYMYVYLMSRTFTFDHYSKKEKEKIVKKQTTPLAKQNVTYSFGLYIVIAFIMIFDNINYLMRNKKSSLRKCLPPEFYLYEIAKNKIKRDLSLKNVLRLLYDVDKLKWLLMSQDQMIIFNSLAKPVISYENVLKNSDSQQINIKSSSNTAERRNALRHSQIHDFYEETVDQENEQTQQTNPNSSAKVFKRMGTINLNVKKVQGGIFEASVIDHALSHKSIASTVLLNPCKHVKKFQLEHGIMDVSNQNQKSLENEQQQKQQQMDNICAKYGESVIYEKPREEEHKSMQSNSSQKVQSSKQIIKCRSKSESESVSIDLQSLQKSEDQQNKSLEIEIDSSRNMNSYEIKENQNNIDDSYPSQSEFDEGKTKVNTIKFDKRQ